LLVTSKLAQRNQIHDVSRNLANVENPDDMCNTNEAFQRTVDASTMPQVTSNSFKSRNLMMIYVSHMPGYRSEVAAAEEMSWNL